MEKIIIAALSNNGVIGNKGQIPWHISQDLKRFRKLTLGSCVIMGRKTYESIGMLDKRVNIVITRNNRFNGRRIIVCHSIEQALEKAENNGEQVYICGGREIYEQTIDLVDKLQLTKICRYVKGDTSFPKINWNQWEETYKERHADYAFHTYERIV